ncbi:hypothetical protein BDR06DRAFT_494101 [Suillus hirtellus]|nr:hypothetical protein BDR06DRAFT_494101 [Suillus hirtellus]
MDIYATVMHSHFYSLLRTGYVLIYLRPPVGFSWELLGSDKWSRGIELGQKESEGVERRRSIIRSLEEARLNDNEMTESSLCDQIECSRRPSPLTSAVTPHIVGRVPCAPIISSLSLSIRQNYHALMPECLSAVKGAWEDALPTCQICTRYPFPSPDLSILQHRTVWPSILHTTGM